MKIQTMTINIITRMGYKKSAISVALFALTLMILSAGQVPAADHSMSGMDSPKTNHPMAVMDNSKADQSMTAMDTSKAEHPMAAMDNAKMDTSGKIGTLIHESMVDGYSLGYYLMDLRDQESASASGHDMSGSAQKMDSMGSTMDKPHHLMVYVQDMNHTVVEKASVGFLIKDAQGNKQKVMGMYMNNGFGNTADMKKPGMYTITAKVVVDSKKLMDSFNYEAK
ncbi:MAG: hypothetical protein V1793_00535 [Pseudomonadota bacterium]